MEKLKIDSHIDLMSSFRQFQSETKFTDLRITAKDHNHTFNCHKLVIGAASGLLASLLKSIDFTQENVPFVRSSKVTNGIGNHE